MVMHRLVWLIIGATAKFVTEKRENIKADALIGAVPT